MKNTLVRHTWQSAVLRASIAGLCFTASIEAQSNAASQKQEIPNWTTEDFYVAIEKNDVQRIKSYLADSSRSTKEYLSYYLLDHALSLERSQIAQLMVASGAGIDTFLAVQYANLSVLEDMLERGVRPRGAALAAAQGDVPILKLLLKYGATDIETRLAARADQLETLRILLDAGAAPRGLSDAVVHASADVVQMLLDSGADPNELICIFSEELPPKFDSDYLSPLHYAVIRDSSEIVELLLKYGADPNKSPSAITLARNRSSYKPWPTVLQIAEDPEWGNSEIAKVLKENGAMNFTLPSREDIELELELYKAADERNYESVVDLLERGAQPPGFGRFFYDYTSTYSPRIMQAFVEAGANPNIFVNPGGYPYTPLGMTIRHSDIDNFRRLIEAGAILENGLPVAAYTKTASVHGSIEVIEILWNLGYARDSGPLIISANYNHVALAEWLLSKGMRPVALWHAVSAEHPDVVRLLLEAGADPNANNPYDERSILKLASATNNEEIISRLKRAGAR